jgi:phosphatidylglycerophosphatase C
MKKSSIASKPVIAAFDFDGTITTRDTIISFLFYVEGKWNSMGKLAMLVPAFLQYAVDRLSRQEVKEAILKKFFEGMRLDKLNELGKAFAHSKELNRLIRSSAKERIDWHIKQNHQCILISAGIDVYLDNWGKEAGFSHILCSQLDTDAAGIVTGKLRGSNCWGSEKMRRLEELLGPREHYILYAYGDSKGDRELLNAADYPFFCQIPKT